MSTLHDSEDGRGMLDLVDKLRKIDKIEKTIPLPQIVVVGQQSSGKSSVLHAISGIQFPIHDGLCTQFPTEIVLRREQSVRTKASIRHHSGSSKQRRSDFEAFETKWQNSQLSDLKNIISDAKKVLQLNDRNRFSNESLVLEISGPDQEHLTLIDLPGFIVSTQTGQSSNDIRLVNDIAKRYTSNNRAVVLAVVSGRTDLENQLIFEHLKSDLDFRQRTLGVITAPDAIEPGSQLESQCVQLLKHDPRGLGYGWHVLRNLKLSEVNAGIIDRDTVETQFFEQTSPWRSLEQSCVGSQALKKRLSSILKDKIAQSLPEIQNEVDLKLEHITAQLGALGEARQSPRMIRKYLCQRARKFEEEAVDMMSNSPPRSIGLFTDATPSLRAYVQSKHEAFAQTMFEKAQIWSLNMDGVDKPERLQQICHDRRDGTAAIPHNEAALLIFKEISQHKAMSLSDLLHPDWASKIFQYQSERWLEIAQVHGQDIYHEMSKRIREVVAEIFEEDAAEKLLQEIVEPALRERKRVFDKKLEELRHPYNQRSIYCVSRRYNVEVNKMPITEQGATDEFAQCCKVLRSAEAFYKVAVDVFTENVISLGVEMCLLDKLFAILSRDLFDDMSDEELLYLGSESEETQSRREQLLAEKMQFEEARDHVLPGFNRYRTRAVKTLQHAQQRVLAVGVTGDATARDGLCHVEVTAATPTTPKCSIADEPTSTLAGSVTLDSIPLTRTRSPDSDTTPLSSIRSSSSGRHSPSTSSVSSYNKSPAQSPTKIRRASSQGISPWFGKAAVDKSVGVLLDTSQDDDEEL